jgi:hypothetical protein
MCSIYRPKVEELRVKNFKINETGDVRRANSCGARSYPVAAIECLYILVTMVGKEPENCGNISNHRFYTY